MFTGCFTTASRFSIPRRELSRRSSSLKRSHCDRTGSRFFLFHLYQRYTTKFFFRAYRQSCVSSTKTPRNIMRGWNKWRKFVPRHDHRSSSSWFNRFLCLPCFSETTRVTCLIMEIIFDPHEKLALPQSVQIYIGKYVEPDFEMQIFDRFVRQIFARCNFNVRCCKNTMIIRIPIFRCARILDSYSRQFQLPLGNHRRCSVHFEPSLSDRKIGTEQLKLTRCCRVKT